MPEYVYGNCLETQGDFGEQISCAEGTIVEGICGSGKREDCDGSSHIVREAGSTIQYIVQSGVSYLWQGFVMFFHASCKGLPGQ